MEKTENGDCPPSEESTTPTILTDVGQKERSGKLVDTLEEDDPKRLSTARKWVIVLVIGSASLCVTCSSSAAGLTESGIQREFQIGHVTSILSISLFVAGLGIGPLLLGPLSEFYGRRIVYLVSFGMYFLLHFPVALANNAAVFMIFRFVSGIAGSAFLSVAGGSVSDLFDDRTVANPMAMYTISPFLGPILGPAMSGFINQNTDWRWTYYVMLIWTFFEWVALLLFAPETYTPALLQQRARRLRKQTGDDTYYSPLDESQRSLLRSILISCYLPFKILLEERMALLLDTWTALLLGILYLTFQAFPIIFGEVHGFNLQMTGLSFLGMGLGLILGLISQPLIWNKIFLRQAEKHNGDAPPEARLLIGMAGAILTPISLFSMAFTTYPHVHWIAPIIASIPLGTGIVYSFTAVFTFLVTAYRPNAASAMAGNSFMRSSFAAAFPLFAGAMYRRLGTVGATALLAGLATLMVPLPFIFYKYGAYIRRKSKFTDVND